jgi:hypothetical protein
MSGAAGCKAPPGVAVSALDAGPPCTSVGDCPAAGSCVQAACVAERCVTTLLPPGTLISKDSPPDCRALVCGPGGTSTKVTDSSNVPPPPGPCVWSACNSTGDPTTTDAPFGFPCSADGVSRCNGFGDCARPSPDDVLTHHNDNARTGLQPAETLLTTANVDITHFGVAFTIPVDDDVYAQPLYVSGLSYAGTPHDALFVATMGDSAYAFDADTGATLWHASMLPSGSTPLASPFTLPTEPPCKTIVGNIGALATPAIDVAAGPNGTLFEVAETVDAGGSPHFHLHALDLTTGEERPGSPAEIANIQVDGQGVGGDGDGHVLFDPTFVFSRLSLLVASGRVYAGFSSICDQGQYHGWLLAYDEQTLSVVSVFNPTPDTMSGGIWQGGDGPTADVGGNLYVVTGNGPFNANTPGGRDYGDTMLRLTPSLEVTDYFTPYDATLLAEEDLDLGSAGALLIPGTGLLAHVSKTDILRVVDSVNMGGYDATGDPQIIEELELGPEPTPTTDTEQHQGQSNPVAWTGPSGTMVYFQTWQDPLRQYQLASGQLRLVAVNDGEAMPYYPGAGLSVSANGSASGTGIVWALMGWKLQQGTLMALDAENVSHTLWTSSASDDWLYLVHTKPTIANGRVYVPTGSKEIVVYANR